MEIGYKIKNGGYDYEGKINSAVQRFIQGGRRNPVLFRARACESDWRAYGL